MRNTVFLTLRMNRTASQSPESKNFSAISFCHKLINVTKMTFRFYDRTKEPADLRAFSRGLRTTQAAWSSSPADAA